MHKFVELMKLLTRRCLWLSDDIEVVNWSYYLCWFAVTFILGAAIFKYGNIHYF